MDLENSTQNSSNIADEPPGDGHTRPIRSNRNKLPSHLNDFVICEEEDLCHFKHFKNLDINHVRLNSVKIFDINDNEKNHHRDHRLTVAALRFVHNIHAVPKNEKDARSRDDWPEWEKAENIEIMELEKHGVGELVDRAELPENTKVLTSRKVYSLKYDKDGKPIYKVRIVARGCQQSYGIDYLDTYAPMSRSTSIRCLAQIAAQYNFVCHQIDVKTAYLNADIDCELYMEQPVTPERDNSKVWRLKKSIYGLKQSAKLWNDTLNSFFVDLGFIRNRADPCLYKRTNKNGTSSYLCG